MTTTLDPTRDGQRLARLLDRVRDHMMDGEWRTLDAIAEDCGGQPASVSARLRDLRKMGYRVQREHVSNGLYKYRVLAPQQATLFDEPTHKRRVSNAEKRRAYNAIMSAWCRLTYDERQAIMPLSKYLERAV